jgi:hypothetical protein
MIDGMLQDAEEHYQTLLQASPKPHVLDDYTVGRVFEVFGTQKDDLWLFEEQLARWKMDKLSVGQRHEVDRLTEQVGRCRTVIDSILSLAEQLKQGTIEKVLAKSDLELGLEFLLSKGKPHHWSRYGPSKGSSVYSSDSNKLNFVFRNEYFEPLKAGFGAKN